MMPANKPTNMNSLNCEMILQPIVQDLESYIQSAFAGFIQTLITKGYISSTDYVYLQNEMASAMSGIIQDAEKGIVANLAILQMKILHIMDLTFAKAVAEEMKDPSRTLIQRQNLREVMECLEKVYQAHAKKS